MCTLTGGVISETGGEHCRGLLSVCCRDRNSFYKSRTNHFHRSRVSLPSGVVRIPRQLDPDNKLSLSKGKGGTEKFNPSARQPRFISGSRYENDIIYKTKSNLTSKQFKSSNFKQTHKIFPQNSNYKEKPELETNLIPDTENYLDCGLSRHVHNVAQKRILGGQEAGYGQFPWTALIQITSKVEDLDKMCAGTLINNR